jgi:hypothetical protein
MRHFGLSLVLVLSITLILHSQDPAATKPQDPSTLPSVPASAQPPAPSDADLHIARVMTNRRTVDEPTEYTPVSTGTKMKIAMKDSLDYSAFLRSGFWAGLNQWRDVDHSYGQGAEGYAKRFGASFGDRLISNTFTEGVYPALFREDPRYFRQGKTGKSTGARFGYAITRVFIARTDNNTYTPNFSELFGRATGAVISTTYHPDYRKTSYATQKMGIQIGADAMGNVAKEFWPDVKRKMFHKQ